MVVILKALSTRSTVHRACVSTLSGALPNFSKFPASAMLKHAASAAASNSSGFDPRAISNREPNVYAPAIDPLSPSNLPVPPLSPPCQVALALRVGMAFLLGSMLPERWLRCPRGPSDLRPSHTLPALDNGRARRK